MKHVSPFSLKGDIWNDLVLLFSLDTVGYVLFHDC